MVPTEQLPAARRIPRWAGALIERLMQNRPPVVSRRDLAEYLGALGSNRDVDDTVRQLVSLRWLQPTSTQGVWEFVPLGESGGDDPYLALRAWQAKSSDARFALAGEAAAWHLGYLDRRYVGATRVWIAEGGRLPFGARSKLSVVHLGWSADIADALGPSRALLRRRGLDLTQWAAGLPAFGPEALLAQLAIRPSSFVPWADLADHFGDLVGDVDAEVLTRLLANQSPTAWQRAAYFAHTSGRPDLADELLARRNGTPLPHVVLGTNGKGVYSSKFNVTDRLVVPRLRVGGKA